MQKHLEEGVERKRCGFIVDGKVPVRGGAELFLKEDPSVRVGVVTSGVPAPSLG